MHVMHILCIYITHIYNYMRIYIYYACSQHTQHFRCKSTTLRAAIDPSSRWLTSRAGIPTLSPASNAILKFLS